eukprot:4457526-Pyramimonas_sp.AAC.1
MAWPTFCVARPHQVNGVFRSLFRLLPPSPSKDIALCLSSWNARALCHHDPTTRSNADDCLDSFLLGLSVVAVQETHGNTEDITFPTLVGPSLPGQFPPL